jgi:hypothetical protein
MWVFENQEQANPPSLRTLLYTTVLTEGVLNRPLQLLKGDLAPEPMLAYNEPLFNQCCDQSLSEIQLHKLLLLTA